jgi:hypothetical protein
MTAAVWSGKDWFRFHDVPVGRQSGGKKDRKEEGLA